MNDSKVINLTPAICTQCGATIEVDPRQEAAVCKFCGTPFIVEKAIIDYNIQNMSVKHVDSINVVKTNPLDSILKFADKQISRRADEKRKIEEEARLQRERTNAFLKKYWWAIAALFIASFIFLSLGAANESKNSAGKIVIGYSSSDLVGENYEEVVSNLENAGFINVETKAIGDLITGLLTKDGEVEKIEIEGIKSFSSDSKFLPSDKVVVHYHTFSSDGNEDVQEPASGENSDNLNNSAESNIEQKEQNSSEVAAEVSVISVLEETFPLEAAKRAAIVAMTNCYALDVFTDDGNYYDPSMFHAYEEESEYSLSVYKEGAWTAKDEHTWHADELILKNDGYNPEFYLRLFLDVTFDGTNYVISDVKANNQNLKYLYDTDPSKLIYEEYDPSDSNPFLIVSPDLLGDFQN